MFSSHRPARYAYYPTENPYVGCGMTRPGEYWITMTDSCPTHNFTLADDPAATDGDELTGPVGDLPGTVTLKIQLKHGTYKLFCSNPSHPKMNVIFQVGGVGQVDS